MIKDNLKAPDLFDLSGKVALVTGAGSGIGQRIAVGLSQCGADVALLDSRTDDGLAQTASLILKTNQKSIQIKADVTSETELVNAEPMRLLRAERDKRIAETDWWAGSDHTMTTAQTNYRQALRDITDNATSLDDVTWPTKP